MKRVLLIGAAAALLAGAAHAQTLSPWSDDVWRALEERVRVLEQQAVPPPGPPGPPGTPGDPGLPGTPGTPGEPGAQGPQGVSGQTGPQGEAGAAGPQGIAGSSGPQGVPGSLGAQGLTGSSGPQGIAGSPGPQGVPGQTGPQGLQGPIGPMGPAGPAGGTTPPPPVVSGIQVGMYYLPTSRFAEWKAKGGTLVHEWCSADGSRLGYLNAALAAGLKVKLEVAYKGGGPTTYQAARDCMRPYKTHAALYGWGGVDEPDLRNMDPNDIKGLFQAMKLEDPNHPLSMVLSCSSTTTPCERFNGMADVLYHDPYPCNYGEPCATFVASWFNGARKKLTGPLNIVLQGFNWKNEFGLVNGQDSKYPSHDDFINSGLNALRESGNAQVIFVYGWGGYKEPAGRTFDQFMATPWQRLSESTTAWKGWVPTPTLLRPPPVNLDAQKRLMETRKPRGIPAGLGPTVPWR